MDNRYSWHRVGTKGGGLGLTEAGPWPHTFWMSSVSFNSHSCGQSHPSVIHVISYHSYHFTVNHIIWQSFLSFHIHFDALFSFSLISLFWQSFASFEIDLSHFSVIPVIHLWHKGGTITQTPPLCANSVPRISVDHWVRGVWAYYYLGFRPRRPLALHGLGQYLSQSLFSDQLVF